MRPSYLIDGYNLIHALGMIQRDLPAGGLEAARDRLLEFLRAAFDPDQCDVTIVFDAMGASAGGKRTLHRHGLLVRFAPRNQTADDLIETLIDEEPERDRLAVISNDARLQHAARRAGARSWSHDDLLDFLEKRHHAPRTPAHDDDKPTSPADVQHWLNEFKPLERDPKLKEFFDLDKFEDR